MTQHLDEFSEFYRYGLRAWMNMISAPLEGAQKLRKHQLAAIGTSLSTRAWALAEIDDARGLEDLVALQAKLVRTQYESVTGYWVGIFKVTGENHVELTKLGQEQAHQLREKLQQTVGAVPDGSVPVMAALQPLVDATSTVYALAARATEETAKRSANQWATGNPNGKQASEHSRRKAA